MSVLTKIAEIMKALGVIETDHMKAAGMDYKYIPEAKLTPLIKQQMSEKGVVVYPISTKSITYPISDEKVIKVNGEDKIIRRNSILSDATVTYRFVDIDDASSFIDAEVTGQGADPLDKAIPKAMTQALKTVSRQVFLIGSPPKNDPDTTPSTRNESPDLGSVEVKSGKHANKTFSQIWEEDKEWFTWMSDKGSGFLKDKATAYIKARTQQG